MPADSKSNVKVIVSLVLIAVALGFLYYYYYGGGSSDHATRRELQVLAIDVEKGTAVMVTQKPDQIFPMKREDGKEVLFRAYVCEEEKVIFPAVPGAMIQICPSCQSQQTGGGDESHKGYRVVVPDGFLR